MPHVLNRLSAHRRAVHSILHCGLAKGHRGNPASGLRLERAYGAPVLLSGTAALILNGAEISALHQHYKCSVRQILRLPITTPESYIMFIAGSLPATAFIHLHTLTLLGMIGRLGRDGILNKIGCQALLAGSTHSWFVMVRHTTQRYGLPDPLLILQKPPSKSQWKSLCKSKVISWWETHYRGEADVLESLLYFNANFYSLVKTHTILTTAGSPYEVSRASVVMLMQSGRYVTDFRSRHFNLSNKTGACRLCPSSPGLPAPPGTLEHMLLLCPTLQPAYTRAAQQWTDHLAARPWLQPVVLQYTLGTPQSSLKFLLDPASLPAVVSAAQCYGNIVYTDCHQLGRVWCFSVHNLRMKMLKMLGHI